MRFVTVIFLALAFICCSGDKIRNDFQDYLTEVLASYLKKALVKEDILVYEMPNFSINHTHHTSDGAKLTTNVFYWAGNLTGLQNYYSVGTEEPSWTLGNITGIGQFDLPSVKVEYKGRFQSIKGFNNPFGVHVRQFDFNLFMDVGPVVIEMELTSSPSLKIPSLKHLNLVSRGNISISYSTEAPSPEDVTEGVERRFNRFFDDLIYGPFTRALEFAVSSVQFPKSE